MITERRCRGRKIAGEEMATQETNLLAAMGRITDVDIAAESTRMAKYNAFLQASAAMPSCANRAPTPAPHAPEVIKNRSVFVYIQLKESNS